MDAGTAAMMGGAAGLMTGVLLAEATQPHYGWGGGSCGPPTIIGAAAASWLWGGSAGPLASSTGAHAHARLPMQARDARAAPAAAAAFPLHLSHAPAWLPPLPPTRSPQRTQR